LVRTVENPSDPRIIETWQNSVNCFLKAAELFPHSFEPVEIPYEGTTIPAYYYKSPLLGQDNLTGKSNSMSKDAVLYTTSQILKYSHARVLQPFLDYLGE